jgi:RNA polymerase primary sigma factor
LPAGQEDALIAKEMSAAIDAVLRTLTPKQEEVIRLRFGLGGGEDEQTFEEIGEQLGLSRARIQQIDSKAMRKLRHPTRSQRLRW